MSDPVTGLLACSSQRYELFSWQNPLEYELIPAAGLKQLNAPMHSMAFRFLVLAMVGALFLMVLSRPVEVPVKLMYSSWNAVHQGDDAPTFVFLAVDPESLPQMEDLIGFKCIVQSQASHTSHGTRFELVTRGFSVLHQLSYPAKASLQVSSPTSSSTLLLTLISIYRALVQIMVVTCSWPQVQNKFKWFNLSAISSCYKTRR